MLGKLCKHEFRTVSRVLLPLHLALLIISLLGKGLLSLHVFDRMPALLNGSFIFFYVLAIIGIAAATFIYLMMRFYKNLFTDEGYLMHTLPVTPSQHLTAKLLTGFVWTIIDNIIVVLSIMILVMTDSLWTHLPELFTMMREMLDEMLGFPLPVSIILLAATFLASTVLNLMNVYGSICIGHTLIKNHKVLGSFIAYIIIYMVNQFLTTGFMVCIGFMSGDMMTDLDVIKLYRGVIIFSLILAMVENVVLFIISKYFMTKKLNLE